MTHIGPRGWKDPTQRHTQTYTAQQQHHLPAASMDFKVFLHTLNPSVPGSTKDPNNQDSYSFNPH